MLTDTVIPTYAQLAVHLPNNYPLRIVKYDFGR